jgi:hypothetical protein
MAGLAVAGVVLLTRWAPAPLFLVAAPLLALAVTAMHRLTWVLNPRRLTIPGFWFLTYLAMTVIPALFLAADKSGPYVGRYLFAVESALLTVPLGMALAGAVARFDRREIDDFFRRPMDRRPPGAHATTLFLVLLGVALALTIGYVIEVPSIPLFVLLRSPGAAELIALREESFKLLDSPFLYAYALLRSVIYPFLIPLALGYFLATRKRFWLITFWITALVGFLYAAMPIAKMPATVMVLVACFLLYLYVGGRVNLSRIALAVTAVLLFPALVYASTITEVGVPWWIPFKAIFVRLFRLPAEILYSYFEIFPDHMPYLHGRSIGRLAWVTGQPAFDVASYVYQYLFHDIESGTAPAGFIGSLHADFGPLGVVAGGLLAGVIMQSVQMHLVRQRKDALTLAAHAALYFSFLLLNFISLPEVLLSGGVLIILALLWAFRQGEVFLRVATAPSEVPSRPDR